MNYIEPNLNLYKNFRDLKEEKSTKGFEWWHDDTKIRIPNLSNYQSLIILAEPGYGKTEFLKQIIKYKIEQSESAICIDLKRVDTNVKLENFITSILSRKEILKTPDFKFLNNSSVTICLDALDEVDRYKINEVLERIKELINDNSNIRIAITCRTLYYETYYEELEKYNCDFLKIEAFNNQQIYQYLENLCFTESQIDLIYKNFFKSGRSSVIQTPRYLNLLVSYLKENGFSELVNLTRCTLFEIFIYSKLKKEKTILNKIDISLFQNILQTLALTMEIYQSNKISREELTTFFADVKNDLKNNIISDISIEEFLFKSILKNNITEIEFDNTEFQEYLAAKAIASLPKYNQVIFDLMVNEDTRDIYPSWLNVLNYLVEMKKDLFEELLDFGLDNSKIIDSGYLDLITNVNASLLKDETKDKLFAEIFVYHQNNKMFMEYPLIRNLSYFYTNSNSFLLKEYIDKNFAHETESHALKRNIFYLIYEILERGLLNDKDMVFWNDQFIITLKNAKDCFLLKSQILILTKYFKSDEISNIIYSFSEQNNISRDEKESLVEAARRIDPNGDITYKLILKGFEDEDTNDLDSFFGITSIPLLVRFFSEICFDDTLLENFHDTCSHIHQENKVDKFIKFLTESSNLDLNAAIKSFVKKSYSTKDSYKSSYSKLLPRLIEYISSIDKNFIFELLDVFKDQNISFFNFSGVFSNCISIDNYEKFGEKVKSYFPDYTYLYPSVLYNLRYSKGETTNELFNIGKSLFPDFYNENVKMQKEHEGREEKEQRKKYKQFSTLLKDSTDKSYSLIIFNYFTYEEKIIEKYIKPDEIERLKYFASKFLSSFNPADANFTITKREKDSFNFTTHTYIQYFGPAIVTADKLNVDINDFRINIINYIPFAYSGHLSSIFNLIKSVSIEELQHVMDVYIKRKDDLWKHNPEYFTKIIKHYKLDKALPQLIEKFNSNDEDIEQYPYYKIEELNLISHLTDSEAFLVNIFEKYIHNIEKNILAYEANKLLIEKYSNLEAIKWRLKYIYETAYEFEFPRGAHTVSGKEDELTHKYFAAVLMNVKKVELIDIYLDLYSKSFDISKRGKYFESYSKYMRDVVFGFFAGLKIFKNYEYFKILETHVKKYQNESSYQQNLYDLVKIKNQYLEFLGKQESIQDCIKKYNELKEKQYIDVYNSKELFLLLKNLIEEDLSVWIKGEGGNLLLAIKEKETAHETELQLLIKMEMDRILLRKGIRYKDINIYREVESLDNKKPDYLISYGLIKPILIELKLSSHRDMKSRKMEESESYKSFIRYRDNFKVDYSILLIYENQNRERTKFDKQLDNVKSVYEKIPNTKVIGI